MFIVYESRAVLLLALLLPLAACADTGADSGGEWAGSVRDSAGIRVVENPAQGMWTESDRWTVDEALRIGALDGAPEYQFGEIRTLDVDDDGRIYVLDGQAQEVRVYDSGGTYVSTIGTAGNGPGELSQGANGVFVDGAEVLVPDMGTQRVNIFGRGGEFVRSWRLGLENGIPMRWDRDGQGRLVAQLRSFDPSQPAADVEPVAVYSDSGAVVDTMAMLPRGRSMEMTETGPRIRLFEAESAWETLPDGGLATGRSNVYRIELHGPDGSLQRVITLPRQPEPIDEGGKEQVKDLLREAMESSGMPAQGVQQMMQTVSVADQYPLFVTMVAGPEGTLWIQQVQKVAEQGASAAGGVESLQDLGAPEWDVIDAEGRYLGVVTLPERFRPVRFVGNDLYGVWRDELDVQYVLKLRLTRPGVTDA